MRTSIAMKSIWTKASKKRNRKRRCFLRQMPKRCVVAEIGVWTGDFSALIDKITKPQELHLIDPWRFSPEFPERFYGGRRASSQEDMTAIQNAVRERFKENQHIAVHAMPSLEGAAAFPDGYFDWVYIDGDHSYEAVLNDLKAWAPKVKKGGFVTGDDVHWRDETRTLPVMRAIAEFADRHKVRLHEIANDQFTFRM
jgi:hypothetical protein